MENELVKVNPQEFGLDESQVNGIETAFLPKVQERKALAKVYEVILNSEITPEVVEQARKCKNSLVKLRTGISKIHKTQKAYFLASGRFVDAWKNKETEPILQMEEECENIAKHYENIKMQEIMQLNIERMAKLKEFGILDKPANLEDMDNDQFDTFLIGAEVQYKKRIEQARIEEETRLAGIKAQEEEKKRIAQENEKLKAEAIERENAAKLEAEKRAIEESERKAKELAEQKKREQIQRIANEKHEAELKAAREKQQKIEREELAKRKKLEDELKVKELAEQKAKEDEEKRIQSELNKGDADKVKDLISDLESLKCKYSFKSDKNKKSYNDVGLLIDKVIAHINI